MNKELKKIKKLYGEEFAHWCREKFPTILNHEGRLLEILQKLYHPSRAWWEEIKDEQRLAEMIENEVYQEYAQLYPSEENIQTDFSPQELCDQAGYVLYKCETVEDVKRFRRYYASSEEICTFKDIEGRLKTHTIFFVVRKDVDQIKRGNPPERDDEYGTSVMSLQFNKSTGRVKITNRYNHTVTAPDSTLDNNPDKIAPGLTDAFEDYYGIKIDEEQRQEVDIPNTVLDENGKRYFYNVEYNGVYYCEDNIVIKDGKASQYPKDRYELIEYFLYDKQRETIVDLTRSGDGLVETFENVEKVDIVKNDQANRVMKAVNKDGTTFEIILDDRNRIIGYVNNDLKACGDSFCGYCRHIEKLELENLENMGDFCFCICSNIEVLDLPKLKTMGSHCFRETPNLKILALDNLENMDVMCFNQTPSLVHLSMRNLSKMENGCFGECGLALLYLPSVDYMGAGCFNSCKNMQMISCPNLKSIGEKCFQFCEQLTSLNMPSLQVMESNCFYRVESLENVCLANVEKLGKNCFDHADAVKKIDMPQLKEMGDGCFYHCENLKQIKLPLVEVMGGWCFTHAEALERLSLPNLRNIGREGFAKAGNLSEIDLPALEEMGSEFACWAKNLRRVYLPKLHRVGGCCLEKSQIEDLTIPSDCQCYLDFPSAHKTTFVSKEGTVEETVVKEGDTTQMTTVDQNGNVVGVVKMSVQVIPSAPEGWSADEDDGDEID